MSEIDTELLDAVIDQAADRPYGGQTPEITAAAIDRLFARRMDEYRAARETVDGSRASAGIEALADLFPTPLWVAYWNILFSTRTDLALRERLLDITDAWEEEILATFPRFLPPGLPDEKVMFFAIQLDALGMATLTIGSGWDRAARVERLVHLWEGERDGGATGAPGSPSGGDLDVLARLLSEFQAGDGPADAWLASHDLFFEHLGSPVESELKQQEALRRGRLEEGARRAFEPEISLAAAQLAICHLDGLAIGSMFVRSIDDLGIPTQLALLRDQIRRRSEA